MADDLTRSGTGWFI